MHIYIMKKKILVLFLTVACYVFASPGDRDPLFVKCASSCPYSAESDAFFPPWTKFDECIYECIHKISELRTQHGYPAMKYFGHWPFIRYFGCDEIASVVFSLLNCIPNVCILFMLAQLGNFKSILSFSLTLQSALAILAWTLSAIFHSKKTSFTTALDYCSALTFLSCSLWVAFYNALGSKVSSQCLLGCAVVFVCSLAYRVHVLLTESIDFGGHIVICSVIAALQVALWVGWLVFSKDCIVRRQKYLCLACQVWLALSSLLELLDFPPFWGIFDAHSLWHLLTIPLGFMWFAFWRQELIRVKAPDHIT